MSDTTDAVEPVTSKQPTVEPVTLNQPATEPAKNPKRVAAGKAVAERTRQAREAQKKSHS